MEAEDLMWFVHFMMVLFFVILFLAIKLRISIAKRKKASIPVDKLEKIIAKMLFVLCLLVLIFILYMQITTRISPNFNEGYVNTHNKIYYDSSNADGGKSFTFEGEKYVLLWGEISETNFIDSVFLNKIKERQQQLREKHNNEDDKKFKIERGAFYDPADISGYNSYMYGTAYGDLVLSKPVANIYGTNDTGLIPFMNRLLYGITTDQNVYEIENHPDFLFIDNEMLYVKENVFDKYVNQYLDQKNNIYYVGEDNGIGEPIVDKKIMDIDEKTMEAFYDFCSYYYTLEYYTEKDNVKIVDDNGDGSEELFYFVSSKEDGVLCLYSPTMLVLDDQLYLTIGDYTAESGNDGKEPVFRSYNIPLPKNLNKQFIKYVE